MTRRGLLAPLALSAVVLWACGEDGEDPTEPQPTPPVNQVRVGNSPVLETAQDYCGGPGRISDLAGILDLPSRTRDRKLLARRYAERLASNVRTGEVNAGREAVEQAAYEGCLTGLVARRARPVGPDQAGAARTACDLGERPDYFVPAETPARLFGCARLRASGKRVEFSASGETISREASLCIHPAYNGRGHEGIYIPAICPDNPPPRTLRVVDVAIPRQAVKRYQLVAWGTAGPSTRRVVAHFSGAKAKAAVFRVRPKRAEEVGSLAPFTGFVVELPAGARCEEVEIAASGPRGKETRSVVGEPAKCD